MHWAVLSLLRLASTTVPVAHVYRYLRAPEHTQVCAAFYPRAAKASKPLSPAAAPTPPQEYTCPISKELMTDPVLLVETGHTYEAANITRWLRTRNTCPLTGQQLDSQQLAPNHSLRKVIHEWADSAGIPMSVNAADVSDDTASKHADQSGGCQHQH